MPSHADIKSLNTKETKEIYKLSSKVEYAYLTYKPHEEVRR